MAKAGRERTQNDFLASLRQTTKSRHKSLVPGMQKIRKQYTWVGFSVLFEALANGNEAMAKGKSLDYVDCT